MGLQADWNNVIMPLYWLRYNKYFVTASPTVFVKMETELLKLSVRWVSMVKQTCAQTCVASIADG